VDQAGHGGWPYRHVHLDHDKCHILLRELKSRLKTKPKLTMLTSLALLTPALRRQSHNTFREAYARVLTAGPVEQGYANFIIGQALRRTPQVESEIRKIQADLVARQTVPEIYRWLGDRSESMQTRLNLGFYQRSNYFLEGMGNYCYCNATAVVNLLEEGQ